MYLDHFLLTICRSHNVLMEIEADAQVIADETDRTSHLQEASYVALKMPPLNHAGAKSFYDPTGSGTRMWLEHKKKRCE